MRRAVVNPGACGVEGDGPHLARLDVTRIPRVVLSRSRVRDASRVTEAHRRAFRYLDLLWLEQVVHDIDAPGEDLIAKQRVGRAHRLTEFDRLAREIQLGDWWRRRLGLVHKAVQAEGPHFVAIEGRKSTAVTTHRHGDVLGGPIRPGHGRGADRQTRLEVPQHIASPGVVGLEIAVDLAPENQTAGGAQRAVALISALAFLPDDLVVAGIHRRKRVADGRAERCGAAAAAVALAVHVGLGPHGRRARLLAGHDIHVAGLRIVCGRAPLRATVACRPCERGDIPERSKDAAAPQEARHRIRTLIDEGIAHRVWLRRRRELARLLFDWLLIDADQRLAVGAIEEVQPAGLAGLVQTLAHLAVVDLIEQHDRAWSVEVP